MFLGELKSAPAAEGEGAESSHLCNQVGLLYGLSATAQRPRPELVETPSVTSPSSRLHWSDRPCLVASFAPLANYGIKIQTVMRDSEHWGRTKLDQ